MTYVIPSLISGSSFVDLKTIVGIIVAVGCVLLGHFLTRWRDRVVKRRELDARMLNVEHGLENLKISLTAKVDALGANLSGDLKAMNASVAAMPTSLDSLRQVVQANQKNAEGRLEFLVRNVEVQNAAIRMLHDDLKTQHQSLIEGLDKLTNIPGQVRRDLSDHVKDCGATVIAPVVKRIEVLEGVA